MALFHRAGDAPDTTTVTAPRPATPARTVDLDRASRARMDRLRLDLAASGVETSLPSAVEVLVDRTYAQWASVAPGARPDPAPVLDAVGVGVGDLVIARTPGARWVLADDGTTSAGLAPAVTVGQDGPLVFPLAAVARRWHAGEQHWLVDLVGTVAQQLASLAPRPVGGVPSPRRPADLPDPPSTAVQELALFALAHALDSALGSAARLEPFAMVQSGTDLRTEHFAGPSDAQARTRVRDAVGATCAVVGWGGLLPAGAHAAGPAREAVFVECSEPGRRSLVVAHLVASTPHGTEPVGEPVILGRGQPLL